jgi:hypothetical protein
MKVRETGKPENPPPDEPDVETPRVGSVDALFETDAAVRHAITKNLKSRRGGSEAIAARITSAWQFDPKLPAPEDVTRPNYVAPGADASEVQHAVVLKGVDALRSATTRRGMSFRQSAGLREGTVELGSLVALINEKTNASTLTTEPTYLACKADLEAETILAAVENGSGKPNGDGTGDAGDASPEAGETTQFVNAAVSRQMTSATSPETRLVYGSIPTIPNSADSDKVQSSLMQTFQLRPGASDVTSYHDFNTLQIAFEHVWTRIFDGQLESLGQELYREYVKLKDFSGSGQPDLVVGSYGDLRRLIAEVRKLSQIVQEDLPRDLRGDTSQEEQRNPVDKVLDDVGRGALAVATGGLSEVARWLLQQLSSAGQKPILNWAQVDSRGFPLPNGYGRIIATFTNNAPSGYVQMRLETGRSNVKIMEFQPWSESQGKFLNHMNGNDPRNYVSNAGNPDPYITGWITVPANAVGKGVIEFASEQSTHVNMGRYILAGLEEKLLDGWQVNFMWTD